MGLRQVSTDLKVNALAILASAYAPVIFELDCILVRLELLHRQYVCKSGHDESGGEKGKMSSHCGRKLKKVVNVLHHVAIVNKIASGC